MRSELFIPQIWKIESERTLFIPQIGKIEVKQSLFIPQIWKIKAERTLFITQIGKIEAKRSLFIQELIKTEAKRTRFIPEIGKIKAKKTNWIEVRLCSSCYTVTRPYAGFCHPGRMATDQTVKGRENECSILSGNLLRQVPKFSVNNRSFSKSPEISGDFSCEKGKRRRVGRSNSFPWITDPLLYPYTTAALCIRRQNLYLCC